MNAKAREELESLVAAKGGKVTPREVVEYARDEDTALHRCFTWGNDDAAEKWRLHEARQLLAVVVTIIPNSNEPVRAYVSLYTDRKSNNGYRPIASILNDDDMTQQMLRDALVELTTFDKKYKHLKQLAGVRSEIYKLKQSLEKPAHVAARVAMQA